ncbi:MAG: hypothetical protein RJB66_1463 [Pseudomonadota bacterium]|jgi:succinate-semialdehyde dehydrogenase/glutarate-semialdehyde dehydrogenase
MSITENPSRHWTTINPNTGEPLSQYFYSTPEEIDAGISELEKEFFNFRRFPVYDRTEGILRLGHLLRKNKELLAQLMAQEMGKPIKQGRAEIEKCAFTCDYYAEMGERFVASEEVSAHYGHTWVVKKPLGIVLAVMPWNFPFWQVIRFAVPAWLTGNVVLLKHAPSVQGCARRIQDLVREAFSSSVLTQLPMTNEHVEQVIGDSRVRAVSFTGSTRVGRLLASTAGRYLKKCVLELGGSDPYLILADADIELAAQLCVKSRFINAGQSCVAAKRFIIHQDVYQDFKREVLSQVSKLQMGDPALETTDIGPMAEERLRAGLLQQLDNSVRLGAQVIAGVSSSEPPSNGKGFFVEPTVVDLINPGMPIFNEECFGPVMPLLSVASNEEAIHWANQTTYGLGAAIFSRNAELAWQIAADEIEAGVVAINDTVQSDPRVPFGGIKDSGWGRELGAHGVLEFVNLKTIGVAKNHI